MVQVGRRVSGSRRSITEATLQVGKVYEVNIQAREGIIDPVAVSEYLSSRMSEQYPEIQILWMQVCERDQTIKLQFTTVPSQSLGFTPNPRKLAVSGIIVWLPSILTVIGLAIIFIGIWQIWATVPWWTWAAILTGAVLVFWGPQISKMFTTRAPPRKRR